MRLKILKQPSQRQDCIVGIDEAGRGPVIGPMVIAGVAANEETIKELEAIGVADSKTIAPTKRSELFDKILSMVDGAAVVYVEPKTMDRWVQRKGLNVLEAKAMATIMTMFRHAKLYILDTPSSPRKFREYVTKFSNIEPSRILFEPKADMKYTIVAAASIIAKVLRDAEITEIKRQTGVDFGSGYPSDPKTIQQLETILSLIHI